MCSVGARVDDDLLERARIAANDDRTGRDDEVDGERRGERRAEEPHPLVHHAAEVDGSIGAVGAPAERQDLTNEVSRPRRSDLDLAQARLEVARVRLFERDLRVTEDDAEHVVEVVSDATGESAERFHLLSLSLAYRLHVPFGRVLDAADAIFCPSMPPDSKSARV